MKTAVELWNEFDNTVKFYHTDNESQISRKERFIKGVESYAKQRAVEFRLHAFPKSDRIYMGKLYDEFINDNNDFIKLNPNISEI